MKKTIKHPLSHSLRCTLVPVAIAALALTGPLARAQGDASSPPPGASAHATLPGEAVPLPEVQTSGGVSYVSGGIPYEQLPAFNAARNQFPLNIEVYERDGSRNAFTADAEVRIINAKSGDVVLETKTQGPYLWAKVPPGQYKVETTLNGKVKESRVSVSGSKTARAIVVFPDGTTE
jgi:hypothetical protein